MRKIDGGKEVYVRRLRARWIVCKGYGSIGLTEGKNCLLFCG